MDTPIYEVVMKHLAQTEQTYQQIADGSGVPKRTVEKVARRETADPGVTTVQALFDYFREHEAKAA